MQAVLFKTAGQEWWWLGGMSLLERNLRLLAAAGCETVLILHPADMPLPLLAVPRPLGITVEAAEVTISTANPLMILPSLELPDHEPLFFFDANLLLDPRVLEALKQRTPPCFLVSANGSPHHLVWRVGWLTHAAIAAGRAVVQQADQLLLTGIDRYNSELSDEAAPFCEKITSTHDLPRGWKLLLAHASQPPTGVVEKYVDPPIVNWLVQKLCETAVTPGGVTLLVIALALVAASLFYQGWFLPAIGLAWGVTILEGVDSKLAHVKLMTSPLYSLAHLAKFLYENAWYLAWSLYLARTSDPEALEIGTAIAICNSCDYVLTGAFTQWRRKSLNSKSLYEHYFSLTGGQSRVYLVLLMSGFFLSMPFQGLQAVLWWAVVTVFLHLGQSVYSLTRHALRWG